MKSMDKFRTNKYDWVIYEKAQGPTKGFYQIQCTKLIMSKSECLGIINLICKAVQEYQTKGSKDVEYT